VRWLSLLNNHVRPGVRILDMGCGTGIPLTLTLSNTFDVTGVDISARQIELAGRNVPTARCIQDDVTTLDCAPASFSAVVAESISHCQAAQHHGKSYKEGIMADSQVTPTTMSPVKKLDGARELRGLIRRYRERTDEARQLAPPVVEAMARLGLFRSLVPTRAGGEEWDWPTWMQVVEELSTADGAVGWIAGVGGSVNAIVSGWVSAEVGQAVFCADPLGVIAGAGVPTGTARIADGGYIVSGRWQFGRASPQACWFVAGYALAGEARRVGPMMLVPAKDVEIIDTWSVGGMRSIGSHDFAVRELFVPIDYTLNAADDAPRHPGPLYRLPVVLTLCSSLGPLALGIARGALDCFAELMAAKVDRFAGTELRERLTVQERVAKAEAAVRSARAFLYEMVHEVWGTVLQGAPLTEQQIALFRLANTHAMAASAQAVALVYHAACTTAIITANPLERFFRDVHVAIQHRYASPEELYQAGRVLLGLPLGRLI
jgi:indole-3-acetate monooxygenase